MPERPETSPRLLTEPHCVAVLRQHGVVLDGPVVAVLGGGVSNTVLAVTDTSQRIVVKQSLERLRVTDDWRAPLGRILTEAAALELTHRLSPHCVPALIFADPDQYVLALRGAPPRWQDWKTCLLGGHADTWVAEGLGATLAAWHSATHGGALLAERMFDTETFEMLRVDPYYRTAGRRAPDLERPLNLLIDTMASRRQCLVHGDFSPKNVLVGVSERRFWIIDFEVAHYGDPVFDLAFLLTHLLLKSLHRPTDKTAYDVCSRAFVSAYTAAITAALEPDMRYVFRHVGGLLAARVLGKSPAEYLTDSEAGAAVTLGRALLRSDPVGGLTEVFALRDQAVAVI